ncbi:MAG: hypothetical protein HY681_03995, partial [Chloroflexi bacterium]|nr:hypothetical protein [Chloroflexota bacterium]
PTPTPTPAQTLLWVTDETDNKVYKYDQDGLLQGMLALAAANSRGRGIEIANNYMWVVDKDDQVIYKYTLAGAFVTSLSLQASNGRAEGVAIGPSSISVVDADDYLVYLYDLSGAYLTTWGLNVDNHDPRGIAISGGYSYIVDDVDNQVYVYNGATYLLRWNLNVNNVTPEGIATNGTSIWVVDRVDNRVYKYDMNGTYLSRFSLDAGNDNSRGIGSSVVTAAQTITFDSTSSGSTNAGASSLTIPHTVGTQSNRILVVGTQAEDSSSADCVTSSVTYNGYPMTKVNEAVAGTSFFMCVSLWYILAPDSGTHNIVINWSGAVTNALGGGIAIYNAAQQAPEAQNVKAVNSGTSIATSITTLTNGAWVIDAVGSGGMGEGFMPLTTGQTERYDIVSDSSAGAGGTLFVANAGPVSLGWSQDANRLAHVLAAFAPA